MKIPEFASLGVVFGPVLSVAWFSVSGMSAVGWVQPEHPVAGALDAVGSALDAAADAPLWSLSDGEVETLLADAHRLEGRLHEVTLRLVSEADRRRASDRAAAASTPAWLRCHLQMTPADARQHVTLSAALNGRLDATRQALADGTISRAHAVVVTKMMDTLSTSLGSEVTADAERQLIDWCRQFDPGEVARLGRRLGEVVDLASAEEREAKLLEKQERDAVRQRHLAFGSDGFGRHLLRGQFDSESAATIAAALDPLAKPRPSTAEGPDVRTPGQRYADAFVELCRRQLASGDLPTRGGEKPQVIVTMDLDKLKRSVGSGLLDDGDRLSVAAVRRLACDAQVVPALLGGDGQPLDLGRSSRTFTAAQRRALGLRDGYGCAFPDCDRPMAWCDGHHIRHWIDGGATDLSNGVLLCCYHHTVIHQGEWIVRMATDGRPEFLPPGWLDRERKPRRNYRYRIE
jgi:hypothetical protein